MQKIDRRLLRRIGAGVGAGALAGAVLVLLVLPSGASPKAPTVYAASSLRGAFPRIASAAYSYGGSGALQLQIEHGAPADVFASASPKEAQALFEEGRCTRPVTFATNVVVLLVPKDDPGHVHSVYTLRDGGRRIAIGAAGVPVGDYTRTLLTRMRLSSILSSNTVSDEADVAGITSKVALGSADAGFAYVTDGKIVADRVKTIKLPTWAQPPVRYGICAVRRSGADTAGANAFVKRVVGSKGRKILHDDGFGLPPRG